MITDGVVVEDFPTRPPSDGPRGPMTITMMNPVMAYGSIAAKGTIYCEVAFVVTL